MERRLQFEGKVLALAAATVVLLVLALLNLRQVWIYHPPTDGVLWQRTTVGLEAAAIDWSAPNAVHRGDLLVAVGRPSRMDPVDTPEAVAQAVHAAGTGAVLDYTVLRGDALVQLPVHIRAQHLAKGRYAFLELVGFLYLAIGLFVLDRRRSASQALHFYLFCLASFALFTFHFTGKLNLFDHIIFWGNETALLLAPCLLVHFALRFPPREGRGQKLPAIFAGALYAPAAVLGLAEVALATGALWLPVAMSSSLGVLDRASYLVLGGYFVAAAFLFARQRKQASPQIAMQARIMAWGTGVAIGPFLFLYIVPFAAGVNLTGWSNAAVLSLALVPLAFGYAIWRHQLLEAEIIFRRGVVYTLATVAVVAAYWGVIALAGALVHSRLPNSPDRGWAVWLLAILLTAVLFEPVKIWVRERVDRWFYRDRYDYRRTLTAFARQLNAAPDLEQMLPQVLDRLSQTLLLVRSAVFVLSPDDRHFVLGQVHQQANAQGNAPGNARADGCDPCPKAALDWVDEHFLPAAAIRVFVEHPRGPMHDLALNYFIPCQLQRRTVAVLGLGKTVLGEYLTGEDLALVETLAGHLAVAIENARLMAALRQKAAEFQRLKDFNQNIVESVQVGIIATNLEGIVESWNAQMEVLSARPRAHAVGRRIGELLGADFAAEFERAAASGRIHNAAKFRISGMCRDAAGGGPRIVDLAIAPMLTARFQRVGHIVLLNDVTTEAEMEQRLIQADRLRSVGLLAAGVAHEVNTPLAVISSYTQMLAKQTQAGDPLARVLDTITQQTFRASEIVGNLLNFSRTGAASFRRIGVNQAVRDALALVEHPLRSAGIHVIAALHPDGGGSGEGGDGNNLAVYGDAGKLQQVLLNLVLNARDAMPSGGTLRLATGRRFDGGSGGSTESRNDRVWIEVSDSGHGIAPEVQHRIFDPFFTTKGGIAETGRRADVPAASMSTGTGLGLAVTYGIVQEHGGHIEVFSREGEGATFRIELPLAAPQPELAVAGD